MIWWLVGGAVGAVVGFGAYAITHRDNFQWGEAALWTGSGALVGATFGAGAQFVAAVLTAETAATAGAATAVAAVTARTAAPSVIDFVESQLPRVQHIMAEKHAWDTLVTLTGNVLQDYRAIQPYLQQVTSTTGRQINLTPQGDAIMEFVSTINGQVIVVRALQLADNVLQITDAWVKK